MVSIPTVVAGQPIAASWGNLVGDTVESHDSFITGVTSTTWTSTVPSTSWFSTGTNPTFGGSNINYQYKVVGDVCEGNINLLFNSGGSVGTGTWKFTAPTGIASSVAVKRPVGSWLATDVSTGNRYHGPLLADDSTSFITYTSASPMVGLGGTAPIFTWATGDTLVLTFRYRTT